MTRRLRLAGSGTQQLTPVRGSLPVTERHHTGVPVKKAPNFRPGRRKSDAAPRTIPVAAGKGDAHAMGEIALLYAEVKDCDSTRQ